MKLYRYARGLDDNFVSCIELHDYEVTRETTACYVIKYKCKDKFILKTQVGKRFAYTTKKQALNSFDIRSFRRVEILESHLKDAKRVRKIYINSKAELLESEPKTWN